MAEKSKPEGAESLEKEILGDKPLSLDEFWQIMEKEVDNYDRAPMMEYIMKNRYPCLAVYDPAIVEQHEDDFPGRLLDTIRSRAGFTIYIYEFAIIIGAGDLAFEEYGNASRMLNSIKEVFNDLVQKQDWKTIDFHSNYQDYENTAWALAKCHDLSVNDTPPTPHGEQILQRLQKDIPASVSQVVRPGRGL